MYNFETFVLFGFMYECNLFINKLDLLVALGSKTSCKHVDKPSSFSLFFFKGELRILIRSPCCLWGIFETLSLEFFRFKSFQNVSAQLSL